MPRIFHVSAFVTDTPFSGNPAAVCLLESPAEEPWMRGVARDMNLSETAFVHGSGGQYSLRWFTPAVEVDLCGHATLATAHVLWTETRELRALSFQTRSGRLLAFQNDGGIMLDFPATPTPACEPPDGLLDALGVEAPVHRSRFDYLVELESADAVLAVKPDFRALRRHEIRGVIVTARGDDVDFVSRFFAPGAGIDEDPVTGSAHCALAPYWAAKLGKTAMRARQLSERGGRIDVEVEGERVKLIGQARTTLRGELV